MDKPKLIGKLNQAIALELCGVLQYNQYAQVLMGPERRIWRGFFEESSEEAFKHARTFGERVVALGGVPTVEHEPVKQTSDLMEMLRNSLELERRAVELYTEALAFCGDNTGYRNLLEEQIWQETEDVEEIEMFLNQVSKAGSMPAPRRASKTA